MTDRAVNRMLDRIVLGRLRANSGWYDEAQLLLLGTSPDTLRDLESRGLVEKVEGKRVLWQLTESGRAKAKPPRLI